MRGWRRRVEGRNVTSQPRNKRIRRSESGASLLEYALLISLIMVVCVVGVAFIGTNLLTGLDSSGSSIGL